MEFADIVMLFAAGVCLMFFAVRSLMSLFYIRKGVFVEAVITRCEKVMIRKSTRVDKEDVTANKYSYEYKAGISYGGEIAGLYSADKFSIGDSINIRYLADNPEKSRYYPLKDFLQFEVPFLVIGVALALTVVVRVFIWQAWLS
ncbi:MAG: DUF3592 domain-containing protein [Defluviitaleaceae bacterium]|nr:DUF3592 domain-containing protein [Defluviitaleaceae bacterium]